MPIANADASSSRLLCGCESTLSPEVMALVDPATDALVVVDDDGRLVGAFPHSSPLFLGPACDARRLDALFDPATTLLLRDRISVASRSKHPSTIALASRTDARGRRHALSARLAPSATTMTVFLRSSAPESTERGEPVDEATFWALFEAAPIPLAIEIASDSDEVGSARLNRQFVEVFGYDTNDVPSVQHWWPLAYPDPDYRDALRTEWFRRVREANVRRASIEPMETTVRCKDGSTREVRIGAGSIGEKHLVSFVDLTDQKHAERELAERVEALEAARDHVRVLQGLLPLCAWCKNIRDETGAWRNLEQFIAEQTDASVTHTICPSCRETHFAPSAK